MAQYKYYLIYRKNSVDGIDVTNMVKTTDQEYTSKIVKAVGKGYKTSEISIQLYKKIQKLQKLSPSSVGYLNKVMELYNTDPEIQKLIVGLNTNEVEGVKNSPSE